MGKFSLALVVGFLSALAACGGGGGTTPPPNNTPTLRSIQITGLSPSLIAGQTLQLKATGSYSDGSTKDVTSAATWGTSDSSIATVAPGGMLTAKASGQCSVSATLAGIGSSFPVTITSGLLSIAVTPANSSIAVTTTQQFIATGTYSDNSTQNLTSQVTWASSVPSIATISTSGPTMGLVSALSAGNTTISAILGTVSGSTVLTVTPATPTLIVVTPPNPTLALGLSQQFTATGTFSDGTTQDVTSVAHWHSSSGSVASITVSGLATASNLGTSTISATFGGISGNTSLTVNAANVNSITIKPSNGSIAQGTQLAFTATGTYNDGSTHDLTRVVTWSSSDTTVLKIGSANGLGSGIAPGLVNVTATLGSLSASVPFTVTNATIVSVSVSPAGVTIPTGGRAVFNATGIFSDSSTQNLSTSVDWSSDNTAVATVGTNSSNFGVSVGISAGTANISASFSYGGASASGSTLLTVSTATLASLTMTPSTAAIAPGSAVGIAANGTFTNGTKQLMSSLCTWTSSNNSVATVSPNGLVSGQSAGVVTITAQDGPISATASVLVESAALTSIQVGPHTKTVAVGFWTPFGAIGTFSNGDTQDLTSFVNWTSSNPAAATISNAVSSAGQATGVQPGTSTISAVFSGQVGTATLTVSNATLTSITLTPSSASIAVGATQPFTATGTFSDGSILDITSQVDWRSSDPLVATVGARGGANGVSSGTSTISATFGDVTGSAVLTVQ
jgi:uncharacterized protein YjdB